jgi:ABC-type polysaccharide/polyol phosphate export permease
MLNQVTAVWKFRHFLLSLVRLDLRLRYRRSVLGIGWSLLNPLAMTAVFAVVFSQLLGGGNMRAYVPHLLIGMAVWGFLRECTIAGCRSLISNEAYIRQSPLPYGIYTLRTVLGQAIHGSIAFVMAVGLTVVIQNTSLFPLPATPAAAPAAGAHAVLWAIIPGLLMAFLTAWAAATICAFVNVYFHDTQHLLEIGAQILFFMTPIIYSGDALKNKGLEWLLNVNPVHLFLELIRAPLVTGQPPGGDVLLAGLALTTAMIGLAIGTTAWLSKRVIFHL